MTAFVSKVWLCGKPARKSRAAFLLLLFFFLAQAILIAQEASLGSSPGTRPRATALEELPGLRERAVVMHIVSRIVEQNQQVVWNSENSRITIPGRPVGLKLVGSNLVVAVQFTPFLRANNQHMLVAQGQIWINVPNEGIRYQTTMQTIPIEFDEPVYFFPLGSGKQGNEARIEIMLRAQPYRNLVSDDGIVPEKPAEQQNQESSLP